MNEIVRKLSVAQERMLRELAEPNGNPENEWLMPMRTLRTGRILEALGLVKYHECHGVRGVWSIRETGRARLRTLDESVFLLTVEYGAPIDEAKDALIAKAIGRQPVSEGHSMIAPFVRDLQFEFSDRDALTHAAALVRSMGMGARIIGSDGTGWGDSARRAEAR